MLVLFATNDLGSALLYYGIFLAMLYVATARLSFVAAALGLFLVGAFAVSQVTPHVQERVRRLARSAQILPRGLPSGYQIVQSLYSIAHGGFGGTGLARGIVTTPTGQQVVPDLNTDFIYSALAQELGLVGVAALLLLYMGFVLRGFQIALAATRRLLEAARRGPQLRLRVPDVRHRRRDHAGHPAHGHHAAVRLVRRLERRRELPARRRADADLQPREPRGAGA